MSVVPPLRTLPRVRLENSRLSISVRKASATKFMKASMAEGCSAITSVLVPTVYTAITNWMNASPIATQAVLCPFRSAYTPLKALMEKHIFQMPSNASLERFKLIRTKQMVDTSLLTVASLLGASPSGSRPVEMRRSRMVQRISPWRSGGTSATASFGAAAGKPSRTMPRIATVYVSSSKCQSSTSSPVGSLSRLVWIPILALSRSIIEPRPSWGRSGA
mmetsp:Transcript_43702/g.117908  ORF Transcript_43702/g.117908 Transcript_43702/m.117908 type:complete len:219 (-) Transcript_43702:9-665(-)